MFEYDCLLYFFIVLLLASVLLYMHYLLKIPYSWKYWRGIKIWWIGGFTSTPPNLNPPITFQVLM